MLALAMSYRTVLVANAVRGRKETLCSVQPFNPFDSVDANKIILALENYVLNGTSKVRKDKRKQVLFDVIQGHK